MSGSAVPRKDPKTGTWSFVVGLPDGPPAVRPHRRGGMEGLAAADLARPLSQRRITEDGPDLERPPRRPPLRLAQREKERAARPLRESQRPGAGQRESPTSRTT